VGRVWDPVENTGYELVELEGHPIFVVVGIGFQKKVCHLGVLAEKLEKLGEARCGGGVGWHALNTHGLKVWVAGDKLGERIQSK
jgi:hypothetical protein